MLFYIQMENFQYIALKDIRTNPYQPRKEFSQKKIEELAASIKENGLIQPIILRKSSLFGYEILAGERRYRAASFLSLETIPAVVKELSDDEMLKQAIIENLQREDLNPIKSRPYISNIVRLLQLSKEVRQAIKEEEISQGHARLLVPLKEEEQLLWLEKICREDLSVRAVEKLLQQKKSLKKKPNKELFAKSEEEKIKKILGLEVSIQLKSQSKGKLIIPFESEEEYQRIINSFK